MRVNSPSSFALGLLALTTVWSFESESMAPAAWSKETSRAWTPSDFQLSEDAFCKTSAVDGTAMRTCWDPDEILITSNTDDLENLDQALLAKTMFASPCPQNENNMEATPLQIAVAIVGKMQTINDDPKTIDQTVEVFARSIHDQWGVGQSTTCGGTGVLIFLSVHDRAIYISRGDALKHLLTKRRLETVMQHMKPELQQQLYATALVQAVWEIRNLARQGGATWWERLGDTVVEHIGLMWLPSIFGFVFFAIRKQEQRKREYAKVKSRLSELDRAKAEALQGRFLSVSCPICLESFQDAGYKDVAAIDGEGSSKHEGMAGPADDKRMKGSDGLPLKLLRCGHVFDQTCWDEWSGSGKGDVTKCPICKVDVGKPSPITPTSVEEFQGAPSSTALQPFRRDLVMNRYMDERYFRLQRLQFQYPAYVGPQQVSRWTQGSFNSQLATDQTFVERDPARQQPSRASETSSFSNSSQSGFGGGTSGGGHSGRW
ncbi:hypothetical protein MPSEU_000347900 [Mayamaea pseudoterrestris]|nr:hypothetical protein MPSEU_000347900 [Mayamaea pseudoterrestris]